MHELKLFLKIFIFFLIVGTSHIVLNCFPSVEGPVCTRDGFPFHKQIDRYCYCNPLAGLSLLGIIPFMPGLMIPAYYLELNGPKYVSIQYGDFIYSMMFVFVALLYSVVTFLVYLFVTKRINRKK